MRENDYRKLINNIQTPEELEARVLSAARGKAIVSRRGRPVRRASVCALLALVLVAGGISLQPVKPKEKAERVENQEVLELPELVCSFGLTAYAADSIPVANGNLVLGGGTLDGEVILTTTELRPEREQYTRYRFQISGENIESLTLTMDRGGVYRIGKGQSMISVLENGTEEVFDPETVYGLWVPPQEFLRGKGTSILNGAHLTVTAHFEDGTEQTNTYRLTAQRLQISRNEDGTELLVPTLEGSDQTGVSGLYLESLNSVWFQWPVKGSNTISLSNRYGFRAAPGGQGGTFHAGIDIPAEQGAAVLAAAGGTVIEAGYDAVRGNYLVLDHGNGMETVYGHCLKLAAEIGDFVETGEKIADVGSTGQSTGPHLHFEVRQGGEAQNPIAYFDAETRDTLKMG